MFNKVSRICFLSSMVSIISMPTTALADSFIGATTSPNYYDVQSGNIHITYATTGIDGKPHLTYQNGKKILNFKGDQIRTVGIDIGTLVTVTTINSVDTGWTTFSLLVPTVNLDTSLQAPITTQGITTATKFSVVPQFNTGQINNYQFKNLSGVAKLVYF